VDRFLGALSTAVIAGIVLAFAVRAVRRRGTPWAG
jgi:hypothetical protein